MAVISMMRPYQESIPCLQSSILRHTEHNYEQDLVDLVAACLDVLQVIACSANREFKSVDSVIQKHFNHRLTSLNENGEIELLTARNDTLVNSYNPIQLSVWQGNVDMKYIVSRHKVIEYCAKHATKCEPSSVLLREVFQQIISSLKDTSTSSTGAQKLLVLGIAKWDYSVQETCHLLLQLPMFKTSGDLLCLVFMVLKLLSTILNKVRQQHCCPF